MGVVVGDLNGALESALAECRVRASAG